MSEVAADFLTRMNRAIHSTLPAPHRERRGARLAATLVVEISEPTET